MVIDMYLRFCLQEVNLYIYIVKLQNKVVREEFLHFFAYSFITLCLLRANDFYTPVHLFKDPHSFASIKDDFYYVFAVQLQCL